MPRTPGAVGFSRDFFNTYTPAWSSAGTQPVLNNGTIAGYYAVNGHSLTFAVSLTMGSTTTYGTGGWIISLPAEFRALGIAQPVAAKFVDTSAGLEYAATASVSGSGAIVSAFYSGSTQVTNTTPFTWATTDTLVVAGSVLMA